MKLIIVLLFLVSCHSKNIKEKMPNTKNHLQNETSPYLLQHADNPVDWYPWGEEAFAKAVNEDKPIFLSIGYSSCHWCHVMEHESFEDQEVAAVLNENFISIKVDREERPDIDKIYMMACQLMGGNCGWPLNAIIDHDKNPFLVKTYLPKRSVYGRQGLIETLEFISELWKNEREKINEFSGKLSEAIKSDYSGGNKFSLTEDVLELAYQEFEKSFDKEFGGFSVRPKFPSPHQLTFLLRFYKYSKSKQALDMVTKTLTEMRKGGIFDHVGGGFHRYSTDQYWLLPHFEKMMYDQATLLKAYTEAYQITRDPLFKETAIRIFQYVKNEMTDKKGGFYSAEDADSEEVEGKYYVWEIDDVKNILGNDADEFIDLYGLQPDGNYTEEAQGHGAGGNIPHLKLSLDKIADKFSLDQDQTLEKLQGYSDRLFSIRDSRVHPFKDKKCLTDWNSMMSAALAYASRVFDNKEMLDLAVKNNDFIENKLNENGLLHSYLNGKSNINAMLDDYAYLINLKLELYRSTFNVKYLSEAIEFTNLTIDKFWDEENGGFYFSDSLDKSLIARTKEIYDGAIPSGNSIMLANLLKLYKITANSKYNEIAEKHMLAFSGMVSRRPNSFAEFISASFMVFDDSYEVVIAGDNTSDLIADLNNNFFPNSVVILNDNDKMLKIARYLENMVSIYGKATAYVCKNYTCELPTNDPKIMLENLKK